MKNIKILEYVGKQGGFDIDTSVWLSEDNSYFELYQYVNKEGSPRDVTCNCVILSANDMVKLIRSATEVAIKNASKHKP